MIEQPLPSRHHNDSAHGIIYQQEEQTDRVLLTQPGDSRTMAPTPLISDASQPLGNLRERTNDGLTAAKKRPAKMLNIRNRQVSFSN